MNDLSCVVTGLVITLLMPVNVPQWLPMLAAGFAILAAKAPFGGTGRAPFNPAAAGMAFVTVCFPGQCFQALPFEQFPWWGDCQGDPQATAAALLQQGMRPVSYTHLDVYKRQGEKAPYEQAVRFPPFRPDGRKAVGGLNQPPLSIFVIK